MCARRRYTGAVREETISEEMASEEGPPLEGRGFKTERKGNSRDIVTRALGERNRMLRKERGRAPAQDRCLGRASLRELEPDQRGDRVGKLPRREEQQELGARRRWKPELIGIRRWSTQGGLEYTGRSGELRKAASLDFVLRAIGSRQRLGIRMRTTWSYLPVRESVFTAM